MKTCGKYGVLLGLVAGPVWIISGRKEHAPESIYDRCYRLRHNRNQVRVDQSFVVASSAGVTAAAVMGYSPLLGGLFGMAGGVVIVAAYNQLVGATKETASESN